YLQRATVRPIVTVENPLDSLLLSQDLLPAEWAFVGRLVRVLKPGAYENPPRASICLVEQSAIHRMPQTGIVFKNSGQICLMKHDRFAPQVCIVFEGLFARNILQLQEMLDDPRDIAIPRATPVRAQGFQFLQNVRRVNLFPTAGANQLCI